MGVQISGVGGVEETEEDAGAEEELPSDKLLAEELLLDVPVGGEQDGKWNQKSAHVPSLCQAYTAGE